METEKGIEISEYDLYKRFDELLNEIYPVVTLGQLRYEPAEVLKKMDPIAYQCEFNDWLDTEAEEIDGTYYLKY